MSMDGIWVSTVEQPDLYGVIVTHIGFSMPNYTMPITCDPVLSVLKSLEGFAEDNNVDFFPALNLLLLTKSKALVSNTVVRCPFN